MLAPRSEAEVGAAAAAAAARRRANALLVIVKEYNSLFVIGSSSVAEMMLHPIANQIYELPMGSDEFVGLPTTYRCQPRSTLPLKIWPDDASYLVGTDGLSRISFTCFICRVPMIDLAINRNDSYVRADVYESIVLSFFSATTLILLRTIFIPT